MRRLDGHPCRTSGNENDAAQHMTEYARDGPSNDVASVTRLRLRSSEGCGDRCQTSLPHSSHAASSAIKPQNRKGGETVLSFNASCSRKEHEEE
jgi:hypothetical protein